MRGFFYDVLMRLSHRTCRTQFNSRCTAPLLWRPAESASVLMSYCFTLIWSAPAANPRLARMSGRELRSDGPVRH
jgi:hypothetical protein